MPSKYSKTNKEEKTMVDYQVVVTKAKVIGEGRVNFNITVNGVSIYGMHLIEYTNKEGQSGTLINFPQWKGEKDGQATYNNYCFFPISKEMKEEIIAQIDKVIEG